MTINIKSLAFPYVHVHCDRGHLVNAFVNPKVSTASERVSDKFKHHLIPLNIDGSVISIIDLGWKMTPEGHVIENDNPITSSDFMNRLARWKYIAICTTDGKLLSNRRPTKILSVGETSLTEYRKEVGEFEVFEVELDPKSGYFSFKSHNDMYLQPNLTFSTTPCRPSKFLWKISPLLEDYKERVEFVGVCRLGASNTPAEFVMKKTAVDGLIGEAYINPIVERMYANLQSGQSHCFHGKRLHLWHYFLRGHQDELYMVVTTHKFSSAYATDFMGELPHLYDEYVADGGERDATKELYNLTLHYDMENKKYIPEQLHELILELEQNISNLRGNLVAADDIKEFSEGLVKQAEVFKKRAAGLKKAKAPPNGVILAASIVGVVALGATIVVATGGVTGPVAGAATAYALGEAGAAAAGVGATAAVAAAEVGTAAAGIGAAATAATTTATAVGVEAGAAATAAVAAAEVGTAAAGIGAAAATTTATAVGVEAGAAATAAVAAAEVGTAAAGIGNAATATAVGVEAGAAATAAVAAAEVGTAAAGIGAAAATTTATAVGVEAGAAATAAVAAAEVGTAAAGIGNATTATAVGVEAGTGAAVATAAGAETGCGCIGAAADIWAAAGAGVGLVGEGVRNGPRLWKDYVSSVQHD